MDRVIQSPGKYVQGADVLPRLGEYLKPLADSWLLISDQFVLDFAESPVRTSLESSGLTLEVAVFNGECSQGEIKRLSALAAEKGCHAIVGMGGGKALDTAKAVAYERKLPVAVVPTLASTDAPCSALSVLYTDEGVFDHYLMLPSNPELVLVDTRIVAQAPARLLAAGMGDALATWVEARASSRSYARTMAGGLATHTALALARLCYDILLKEGENAMLAVQSKLVTPALESVVEANTYLSGVGFESGGVCAAHAVHNGLTAVDETHHLYHGEKVAFGVLVQLVMENAPANELQEVMSLCRAVGLPLTFEQLGVTSDIPAKMQAVAELACAEGETIHDMPGGVTPERVYAALLMADQIGRRFLASGN